MDVDDEKLITLLKRDPETLREKILAEEIEEDVVVQLAKRSVESGRYYDAVECFTWLSDDEGLRRLARIAFDDDELDAAQYALETIDDCKEVDMALLERVAERVDTMSRTYDVLAHTSDRLDLVRDAYVAWCRKHGFEDVHYPVEVVPGLAAMGRALSQEFDVIVGVPRGGLLSAFVFDRFGCHVGLLEYHRDSGKQQPVWVDEVDVDGEAVLVVDKDVRSGDTLLAVQGELEQHSPGSLSVAFMWGEKGGIGSLLSQVPESYEHVFVPEDFSEYMPGFKALENRL